LEDAFNHCLDAARYALEPVMKRGAGRQSVNPLVNESLSAW
jgi:hypothetical protein